MSVIVSPGVAPDPLIVGSTAHVIGRDNHIFQFNSIGAIPQDKKYAGEPTEFMKGVQSYLEQLDAELQRTRAFCQRLVELDLLQDMRFDAQMEDGQTLVVDGFLAINEQKLAELPDATVVELHRSGILALLYAHIGSMAMMRRLVERRVALKLPV